MEHIDGGFALYDPNANRYVQFDKRTIVFDTIDEVAEFKKNFRSFFTGTHTLPQIVAVDETFVSYGLCTRYCNISQELREEAQQEVEDEYGGEE